MTRVERSAAQLDETALVRRVAQADEEAVATFCRTYSDAVFVFVNRKVGERREDAEEITQDTLVSAVTLAGTFNETCSVFTWLLGIAKLRIVDFYRHEGRKKRIPPEMLVAYDDEIRDAPNQWAPDPDALDETIGRIDAARIVDEIMACLDHDEREALMLRYTDQLSVREVATLLKRTEREIKHLIARAKAKAAKAATRWMS